MNFEQLVEALREAGIPAKVSITESNEIIVEMGFDYPEEVCDKAWPILEASTFEFSVCASSHGYKIKGSAIINKGGPNKQWPLSVRGRDDEDY